MDANTYPAGSAVVIQPRDDDPLGQKYTQGPDHVRHSTYDRVGLVTSVSGDTGLAGPVYVVEMLDGKVLRLRAEHLSEANPATVIKACRGVFGQTRRTLNPLADAVAEDPTKAYVRTATLIASINAPGFYTIEADEYRRLHNRSFTSDSVLDGPDGGEPEEPAGVWITSELDPDSYSVLVNSIHETEVEAWRMIDAESTRPRVTFVEFGAPARQVVRETHGL